MELNKEQIYKKWLPIIQKLGYSEEKTKWLAEYAEIHSKTFTSTMTSGAATLEALTLPFIRSVFLNTDNKIIAHFMELKEVPNYQEDWVALMAVVSKIEEGNYGVKQCRKVVEIYYDDTKEIILKEKQKDRITSLYEAIVKFIKWKHENNK